ADDLAVAIENLRLSGRVRAAAAAAERARVARELHDDTAQQLVAIGRRLELLRLKRADGQATELEAIQTMIDEALANVRPMRRGSRSPTTAAAWPPAGAWPSSSAAAGWAWSGCATAPLRSAGGSRSPRRPAAARPCAWSCQRRVKLSPTRRRSAWPPRSTSSA